MNQYISSPPPLHFFAIILILTCLLFVPNTSFSNTNTRYVSMQYRPAISVFNNFNIQEERITREHALFALTEYEDYTIPKMGSKFTHYAVEFQDYTVNFSGNFGLFYSKNIRIEIEGSYEAFDAKNPGVNPETFRYFAVKRLPTNSRNNNYIGMKNTGLSIASVIINGCYDFSLNNSISPYICAGYGLNTVELFDTYYIKPAYQSKIGITYPISSKISLFVDTYYYKVIGNQFKHTRPYTRHIRDSPIFNTVNTTLNVGYFGSNIGIKFIF